MDMIVEVFRLFLDVVLVLILDMKTPLMVDLEMRKHLEDFQLLDLQSIHDDPTIRLPPVVVVVAVEVVAGLLKNPLGHHLHPRPPLLLIH
jgi:hypothetical protein